VGKDMRNFILITLALAYVIFGIIIFIRPELGAKIIKALPWQSDNILNPKLLPPDQKIVRPSIVRLLGVACIFIGIIILKYV
jgi:uncharacterized protein YjeT (DUF2065 family)